MVYKKHKYKIYKRGGCKCLLVKNICKICSCFKYLFPTFFEKQFFILFFARYIPANCWFKISYFFVLAWAPCPFCYFWEGKPHFWHFHFFDFSEMKNRRKKLEHKCRIWSTCGAPGAPLRWPWFDTYTN